MLLPCLGSQELTIQGRGVLSKPWKNTPLNLCLWKSKPPPIYVQIFHILNIRLFEPLWCGTSPKAYPASLASLANSQSCQPPGQYCNSGPGDHLASQGPWSLTIYPWLSAHPLLLGGLGPFRPPMSFMVCGPWDQLGPFWPNSNEAKRGKGGRPVSPIPGGTP
ncbi:hypothetical protein O181_004230 [Austropuccinia psidii MF-1]|uniref:Uncharacterized protein n=1 Tax=Austropuccinia psidii MF-1 TaxID=1389203 RepID=A0A9Q3GEN5_9BASI|nr:hypothetical protein [Austropuccinia psidii MF-1]